MENTEREEIIKRWMNLGFLDKIEDKNLREQTALKFEELADYLIHSDDEEEHILDTLGFPIITYITTKGTDEQKEKFFNMKMDDFVANFIHYYYKAEAKIVKQYCEEF